MRRHCVGLEFALTPIAAVAAGWIGLSVLDGHGLKFYAAGCSVVDALDELGAAALTRGLDRVWRCHAADYRPSGTLEAAAGVFDFLEANIDSFLALGYRDGLAHDCTAEACILPGAPPVPRVPGSLRRLMPAAPAVSG